MKNIPITKLRNFYESLAKLRLATKTQLNIAEDLNEKENYKQIIALYKESKEHFAKKYEYNDEPFLSKSSRKPIDNNVISISRTQNIISVFQANKKLIHVKNDSKYDFKYLQREVSPLRTTNAEFETGKSGKSSGNGGIDFIGLNLDNDLPNLPILGEIKVGGDQNPFYALIQLLTYLSELSTPNQIKRINKTELFGNIHLTDETSFYLYILLVNTSSSDIKKELLSKTQNLAARLQEDIKEIKEIVFLKMDPSGDKNITRIT